MRIHWDHGLENYCAHVRYALLPLSCSNHPHLTGKEHKPPKKYLQVSKSELELGSLPQCSFHSSGVLPCCVSPDFSVHDLRLKCLLVTVCILSPTGLTSPSWTMATQYCTDWKPAPAPGSGAMPTGEGTLFLLYLKWSKVQEEDMCGCQGCLLPWKAGSCGTEYWTFHMDGVHWQSS